MAIVVVESGIYTSTGGNGAATTVTTQTEAGVYVVTVDINDDVSSGDSMNILAEVRAKSGGVYQMVEYRTSVYDDEELGVWQSNPIVAPYGCRVRIRQVSDTNRTYDYNVVRVT